MTVSYYNTWGNLLISVLQDVSMCTATYQAGQNPAHLVASCRVTSWVVCCQTASVLIVEPNASSLLCIHCLLIIVSNIYFTFTTNKILSTVLLKTESRSEFSAALPPRRGVTVVRVFDANRPRLCRRNARRDFLKLQPQNGNFKAWVRGYGGL